MAFINDLNHDEVRNGFLVKSSRKKVWERQLEMWQEVDRICRKHFIAYWATYGTLLGAARHKGFVPWYDKFELCMMRPDYNRFCQVVAKEFIQSGGTFEIRHRNFTRIMISHAQTTLLTKDDLTDKKGAKGLLIEIYPLDATPDGTSKGLFAANGINELFITVYNFQTVEKYLAEGNEPANDLQVIEALHALPDKDKQLEFLDKYAEGVFDWSIAVNRPEKAAEKFPQLKNWYCETIRLPFETVELPAPVGYDKVLRTIYGDWHKFVCKKESWLGAIHSADIPYRECLAHINAEMILETLAKNERRNKENSAEAN